MKVIDTIPLVPSRYGEHDLWVSADEFDGMSTGRPVQLRMRCRYTRRVERLTVLYTGPGGATRVEQGCAKVPGPRGELIPQSTVISAHPATVRPVYMDVAEGDVLVLENQRMVIVDDAPMGYPYLVTEAEWGLLAARRVLRDQIAACGSDDGRLALGQALADIARQADTLRAQYRGVPKISDAHREGTVEKLRSDVAAQWPTVTAVAVVFKAEQRDGGYAIGATGTVVFDDGSFDGHPFPEVGDVLARACGFLDRNQAAVANLRDGTVNLVYLTGDDEQDIGRYVRLP